MKRLTASFLLLARLATAQSWGPMFDQQNTMLNTLSTDSYTSIVGNLLEVLTPGTRKQVYNTVVNLPETWVGTSAGNRLATVRAATYAVTITTGQTVVNIPHGLPYTPAYYGAQVLTPGGTGNPTIAITATSIVLTFPTAPLAATPTTFMYHVR